MNRTILCLFVVLLAACGKSGIEDGATLVYHLDGKADAEDAREVILRRLEESGADEFEVNVVPGNTIEVLLPVMETEELDKVKSLLARTGRLEFRMVALPPDASPDEPGVEGDERKKRDELGEAYPGPPAGHRWVRCRSEGEPDRLVETKDGFTGADLDPARIRVEPERWRGGFHVMFTVRDKQSAAFTEFTGRNVKRLMAIILDDRLVTAPIIQEALPGHVQISGGGLAGFSETEAEELATLLRSGPLPGRLTLLAEFRIENGEVVLDE